VSPSLVQSLSRSLRPIPVNPKLISICSPSFRSYLLLIPEGRNVTKVRTVPCCNSVTCQTTQVFLSNKKLSIRVDDSKSYCGPLTE